MAIEKHKHYFKDVSNLDKIDIYRILKLYDVTEPTLQHAVKKLLVAGNRGVKDKTKDIQETIDSCQRYLDMVAEDLVNQPISPISPISQVISSVTGLQSYTFTK